MHKNLFVLVIVFVAAMSANGDSFGDHLLLSKLDEVDLNLRDVIYRSQVDVTMPVTQFQACYWLGRARLSLELSSNKIGYQAPLVGNPKYSDKYDQIINDINKIFYAIAYSVKFLCIDQMASTMSEKDSSNLAAYSKALPIVLRQVDDLMRQVEADQSKR